MKQTALDSKNIALGKDITVVGADLGSYKVGDVITGTTKLDTLFTNIFTKANPVSYVGPTGVLTSSINGNVEAGSNITIILVPNFNRNDAGALTKYVLKRGSDTLVDAAAGQNHQDTVAVGDNTVSYQATFTYASGATKNNNLGLPVPQGVIPAGSVSSNVISLIGKRYAFHDINKPVGTSNQVRALSGKVLNAAQGTTLTIDIPAGTTSVQFAYLGTLRDVFKVLDTATNLDVKGVFSKNNLSVAGANNFSPLAYKVYNYTPAQAFKNATQYIITI